MPPRWFDLPQNDWMALNANLRRVVQEIAASGGGPPGPPGSPGSAGPPGPPGPGVAWAERRVIATQALVNNNLVQDWFTTAPGCPLDANSSYEFEGVLSSINGAVSHGLNLQFANIVGASIAWQFLGSKAAINGQATAQRTGYNNTFATNRNVTTASTVAGNVVWVWGTVLTTTAGTLIPRVAQTAASGSFTLQPGTFFRVRRAGSNTLVNTGEWV